MPPSEVIQKHKSTRMFHVEVEVGKQSLRLARRHRGFVGEGGSGVAWVLKSENVKVSECQIPGWLHVLGYEKLDEHATYVQFMCLFCTVCSRSSCIVH